MTKTIGIEFRYQVCWT